MVNYESQSWHPPDNHSCSVQVTRLYEKVICQISFVHFLESAQNIGAKQPVDVRFIFNLVANSNQQMPIGRSCQGINRVADPVASQIDPTNNTRYKSTMTRDVE